MEHQLEQMLNLLQMKQLECSTLKVANQTLRERIQWLEHLCSELQERLFKREEEEEEEEPPKKEPIGFRKE